MNTIPIQISLLFMATILSAWFLIVAESQQKATDLRNQEAVIYGK